MHKDTTFSDFSIKMRTFHRPAVMGILNVTPDSFYDGGRYTDTSSLLARARQIVDEGADIIDIGAVSSRPGATLLPPEEEAQRLVPAVEAVRAAFPHMLISVDTCLSLPARLAVEAGADMVNDISGGQCDPQMFPTVASLQVPYILMHSLATPDNLHSTPHYDDILQQVAYFFSERLERLYSLGVSDVILDPGFGFSKSLDDNYLLLHHLRHLRHLFPQEPMLIGLSRKSMIYNPLDTTPDDALAGTIALHTAALLSGASLLRVHDVKAAVQTVQLIHRLQQTQ